MDRPREGPRDYVTNRKGNFELTIRKTLNRGQLVDERRVVNGQWFETFRHQQFEVTCSLNGPLEQSPCIGSRGCVRLNPSTPIPFV